MTNQLNGVLHLDKPLGMTSHDVVNVVRRIAGFRRVGHSGTLDPLASGLLILCLGKATRLLEFLVGLDKVYIAQVRFGQETETYDREGRVIRENPVDFSDSDLRQALASYTGQIDQSPPMYSAVKVDGQPLYKLARQGHSIERPVRQVTIYWIHQLAWKSPYLEIEIKCSSGTYIRSIAHDLGTTLGCGAHLSSLRRVRIGRYSVKKAIQLDQLDKGNFEKFLHPSDSAVEDLPKISLTQIETRKISHGQRILIADHSEYAEGTFVRTYNEAGTFIGIVKALQGEWHPYKIFYQPT